MAERQIGQRKSSLVLSSFFHVQENDVGGKLNNMNAARYCLLLLAFLFRKITHTMRIFHSER